MRLQQREPIATVMRLAGDGTSAPDALAPLRKRHMLERTIARMR